MDPEVSTSNEQTTRKSTKPWEAASWLNPGPSWYKAALIAAGTAQTWSLIIVLSGCYIFVSLLHWLFKQPVTQHKTSSSSASVKCGCFPEWVPGGVVCGSEWVHPSKWDHFGKCACVSVCLKSVTIFITSGRIMQSVVSTDPARWNAENFGFACPLSGKNHGRIFQRDRRLLDAWCCLWLHAFCFGGEIMQSVSPYGSALPQKNNVKRPTHISSLVNNLLISLIDYTHLAQSAVR